MFMTRILLAVMVAAVLAGCASLGEATTSVVDRIKNGGERAEEPDKEDGGYGEPERIVIGETASTPEAAPERRAPDGESRRPDFTRVDDMARSVPESEEQSVQSLAAYFRYQVQDDLELARAIFIWLTDNIAYDTEAYFAGTGAVYAPESVLRKRKSVCEGYARLYKAIGEAAGLVVEQVTGYAKGYGYATGSPIRGTNHAWNRVLIGEEWLLIDATWGAGSVNGRTFVRRFNEFYFGPNPKALIFSHLPTDAGRQQLDHPVAPSEFSAFPEIPEELFVLGLDPDPVLEALRGGEQYFPPRAYAPPGLEKTSIQAVEIPWDGRLSRGREYRFALEIDPPAPAAVVNGNDWTPMEYDGTIASAVVTPRRGDLGIAVKPSADEERYAYVIQWEVE